MLVGGNNAGKSSVLHAMAVWEFCKTLLEFSKGTESWLANYNGQGVGVSASDFTPISIPSLKHLWTDLRTQRIIETDGYTLKVRADWTVPATNQPRHLQFGLSLANDRLFIKPTSSNLTWRDMEADLQFPRPVPKVAYLPPFAGITDKEPRTSGAARNRLIGQGLSGGVIRNVLYDMWERNQEERKRLRGTKTKIGSKALAGLRESDAWEILSKTLAERFQLGLQIDPFDDRYHTSLSVETYRFMKANGAFRKVVSDVPRDLMVEGSGFLQWLSVYALALSPDIDVLLLDEPDSHLHCSLQIDLVNQLVEIARQNGKQILMASHSTELIKSFPHHAILEVQGARAGYLGTNERKIGVIAGLGSTYSPKLHAITQHQKVLFLEGTFDEGLLKIWAQKLQLVWPDNVVVWLWPGKHSERRQLFLQLQATLPNLKAISLRDRDDEQPSSVAADLRDTGHKDNKDGFMAFKWRRRQIDSYLLCPAAISRASGKDLVDVYSFFAGFYGLAIEDNPRQSKQPDGLMDARGKEILSEGPNCAKRVLGVKRHQIAQAMTREEIPEDVELMLDAIFRLSVSDLA